MPEIKARWADDNLKKFGREIAELHRRFPKALPREINKVGQRAKTQVIRALVKQTGLPRKTIVKAVGNPAQARANGRLSYEMVTRGGNIRLKYLNPLETRAGVQAKPFGKKTLYPGTFMRGGAFPNRKFVPRFDGHVMFRNRSSGRHYTFARSGVIIPAEMTVGATKAAFERTAGPLLEERIDKLIGKLLK